MKQKISPPVLFNVTIGASDELFQFDRRFSVKCPELLSSIVYREVCFRGPRQLMLSHQVTLAADHRPNIEAMAAVEILRMTPVFWFVTVRQISDGCYGPTMQTSMVKRTMPTMTAGIFEHFVIEQITLVEESYVLLELYSHDLCKLEFCMMAT
jgi:hypothetical protein